MLPAGEKGKVKMHGADGISVQSTGGASGVSVTTQVAVNPRRFSEAIHINLNASKWLRVSSAIIQNIAGFLKDCRSNAL